MIKANIKKRLEFLSDLLQKNYGKAVTLVQIRTAALKALEVDLSDSQILFIARKYRDTLPKPSRLRILGQDRILLKGKKSEDEVRDQTHPVIKQRIAHVLWHFLLGKRDAPEDGSREIGYMIPDLGMLHPANPPGQPSFEERLERLRGRYGISMLVDSGSTTRAVVRSMIACESMPFETGQPPGLRKGDVLQDSVQRYILPTLVTNSPRAVVEVLDSPHVNKMDLRILGGAIRGEYGSIAGELTLECMAAWGHSGKSIRYDVAVVGTTGFVTAFSGGKAFGVEHLEEATLKVSLLSAAQIRCVIMDSSKLTKDEVSCTFAPVRGEHIDIVFLDAGLKTAPASKGDAPRPVANMADTVWSFAQLAMQNGVFPVIALGEESSPFEEEHSGGWRLWDTRRH